jgi:sterol 3beta-glucosyltransferase
MALLRDMTRQNAAAQGEVWTAIQEAECVIEGPTATGALEAFQTRGTTAVFAVPVPFAPTGVFPSFFFGMSRRSLGKRYNRLTHALMHRLLWSTIGAPISNPLRRRLGLRPWRSFAELMAYGRSVGTPWLYGYSPQVLPKPGDWDEHQHITGYWFLEPPPAWRPAPELVHFLESGPPPVYIGFGSMGHGNPEHNTRLALRALELSGQRGLLLTGWGGLARQTMPPNVFIVEDVPHAWLFPRLAAVVHHGGAGTTGMGLRAGVPNIIVPFASVDQVAWAERVETLGVGPRAPRISRLAAEQLAQAITVAVNDAAMRARAAALGRAIRAENGIARAVEIIERHAARVQAGRSC